MESSPKKNKVKSSLLTDFDMLLIVEKFIRDGICHAIHRYGKAKIINTKEIMIKIKNYYILSLGM